MKRFCLLAGIVFLSAPVASFAGTVDNWSCYTNDGTTYAALVASAALSENATVYLGETAVEGTHTVNDRLVIAEIPSGTDCASTTLSVMDGSTQYN